MLSVDKESTEGSPSRPSSTPTPRDTITLLRFEKGVAAQKWYFVDSAVCRWHSNTAVSLQQSTIAEYGVPTEGRLSIIANIGDLRK